MTPEDKKAMEAYRSTLDIIDQPQPDLKLRGKTYTHLSESTILAATTLINATRQEGLLANVIAATSAQMASRKHPEFLDVDDLEAALSADERETIAMEGIEAVFALALNYVRQGLEKCDTLNAKVGRMVQAQRDRIEGLKDSEEWKLVKSSPRFNTKSVKDMMGEEEKTEEKDDYYGPTYL